MDFLFIYLIELYFVFLELMFFFKYVVKEVFELDKFFEILFVYIFLL